MERCFPQIYQSETKLLIDLEKVIVERQDFMRCLQNIIPSSYRIKPSISNPLASHLNPLLLNSLNRLLELVKWEFPVHSNPLHETQFVELNTQHDRLCQVFRPRLLINSSIANNGFESI